LPLPSVASLLISIAVKKYPINLYSSHPYLRYLYKIPLMAPDMQQGLSIFIGFKERGIIAMLFYLTYMHPY
jgi:hypothetical protein